MYWEPSVSHLVRPSGFDCRETFLSSLPAELSSLLLFLRYVDNRLILGPEATMHSQQMQRFCDPGFYQGIGLETVSDHQWLGFTIDAAARSATFNMPEQPWQLRSPANAGSWKLTTSGYVAPCFPYSPVHLDS